MAYNLFSPHITFLLFDPLSLSSSHALRLFFLSLPFYFPSLTPVTCDCSWWFRGCASMIRGFDFVVVVWRVVGLISWVFVGYDMSLNFVVVRFVGEDMLDGVAVSLVAGRGWLCLDGSDRFMGQTGSWFVGFFFFLPRIVVDLVVGRGWFGSWVFFGCGLWFVGFFLFGYGWWLQIEKWWKRKVVGLWLLWYVVVAGGAMMEVILLKQDDPNKTPTPMELRSITDPNETQI